MDDPPYCPPSCPHSLPRENILYLGLKACLKADPLGVKLIHRREHDHGLNDKVESQKHQGEKDVAGEVGSIVLVRLGRVGSRAIRPVGGLHVEVRFEQAFAGTDRVRKE